MCSRRKIQFFQSVSIIPEKGNISMLNDQRSSAAAPEETHYIRSDKQEDNNPPFISFVSQMGW